MVDAIIDGRGSGKTKKLIEKAHATGGTIVCEFPERMINKIHGYDIYGITVLSYGEFLGNPRDRGPYYIDEIESFCKYLGVEAFTLVDTNI